MKAAVYCATRNLYGDLLPSVKSLLLHSDVEKIYLLIEDDAFPAELPPEVECVNVSGQSWFRPDGPNARKKWTWMVLMRAALAKVFPELERILSLDADTICVRDVSEVWELPLGDSYFAAAKEPLCSAGGLYEKAPLYVNCGVVLFDLARLRRDGKADEIIRALNERDFPFCEQDAVNELCAGRIALLPSEYNACDWTEPCGAPRILHYAAVENWRHRPEVEKYRAIPFAQIAEERRAVKRAL